MDEVDDLFGLAQDVGVEGNHFYYLVRSQCWQLVQDEFD